MQKMNQNRLRTVGGKKRGFKERGEESWRMKEEEITVKGGGGGGNDLGSKHTAWIGEDCAEG